MRGGEEQAWNSHRLPARSAFYNGFSKINLFYKMVFFVKRDSNGFKAKWPQGGAAGQQDGSVSLVKCVK